jgi:hypothetical protein
MTTVTRKRILVALAPVVVGIQFVPVDRAGAPPDQPLQAPPAVMAVLQRSCDDCCARPSRSK